MARDVRMMPAKANSVAGEIELAQHNGNALTLAMVNVNTISLL